MASMISLSTSFSGRWSLISWCVRKPRVLPILMSVFSSWRRLATSSSVSVVSSRPNSRISARSLARDTFMRSGLAFSSLAASTTSTSTSPSSSVSMSVKSSSTGAPGFWPLALTSLPLPLPLAGGVTLPATGLAAALPTGCAAALAGCAAGLAGTSCLPPLAGLTGVGVCRAAGLPCAGLGAGAAALAGRLGASACALTILVLVAGLAAGFFAFMRVLYRVATGGRPNLNGPLRNRSEHAHTHTAAHRPRAGEVSGRQVRVNVR